MVSVHRTLASTGLVLSASIGDTKERGDTGLRAALGLLTFCGDKANAADKGFGWHKWYSRHISEEARRGKDFSASGAVNADAADFGFGIKTLGLTGHYDTASAAEERATWALCTYRLIHIRKVKIMSDVGLFKDLLDLSKGPFCYLLKYFRDSPFVIIPTQDNIEEQILRSKYQTSEAKGDSDDPLADYKIPYQQRMEGSDTTSELIQFVKLNNRVLVHGARGVGKTREAAKVAQEFSNDGWTVLNLPRRVYPHPPCRLLCRLLNHPDNHIFDNGVFLFIYDLQKRVVSDYIKTSRIQSFWEWIYNKNYQIDLIRTINYYEKQCERGKFKVLAIASTKGEAQRGRGDDENECNELEHLFSELLKKKKLKPYYLHPPTEEATIKFLSKFVAYADIKADSQDFFAIARINRGSYKVSAQSSTPCRLSR